MFKKFFIKFYRIFTAVIVIICLAIGLVFFVLPFYKETVSNQKANIEVSSGLLKSRSDHLEDLKKIRQEYELIESAKIEKLGFILPEDSQISELFLQIDTIARDSGLVLSSIDASEIKSKKKLATPKSDTPEQIDDSSPKSDKIKTLEVSLSISGGSYKKLKIFLDKIERNIRLVDPQAISFDNSFESIDITFNTYFLNP